MGNASGFFTYELLVGYEVAVRSLLGHEDVDVDRQLGVNDTPPISIGYGRTGQYGDLKLLVDLSALPDVPVTKEGIKFIKWEPAGQERVDPVGGSVGTDGGAGSPSAIAGAIVCQFCDLSGACRDCDICNKFFCLGPPRGWSKRPCGAIAAHGQRDWRCWQTPDIWEPAVCGPRCGDAGLDLDDSAGCKVAYASGDGGGVVEGLVADVAHAVDK